MRTLKIIYRSILVCAAVIVGILMMLFFPLRSARQQGISGKFACLWHRLMAAAFGIPIRIYGKPASDTTLFIANHVSWFDIHALGSTLPVRFLSKDEVRNMPIIGWLASRAGTLYIPRGGRHASRRAIKTMMAALQQDHHVVLFAEGTTDDGHIKRFHSRLVQSAIEANCLVQPVAIRYPSVNGEIMHPDSLFIGDTSMGQSVARMMTASKLEAELHFLPPISTEDKSRDELASYAEAQVRQVIEAAVIEGHG